MQNDLLTYMRLQLITKEMFGSQKSHQFYQVAYNLAKITFQKIKTKSRRNGIGRSMVFQTSVSLEEGHLSWQTTRKPAREDSRRSLPLMRHNNIQIPDRLVFKLLKTLKKKEKVLPKSFRSFCALGEREGMEAVRRRIWWWWWGGGEIMFMH